MNNIEKYGITAEMLKNAKSEEMYAGRVISQEKDLYKVISENGELFAEVSGKFRFNASTIADFPSVGDFVMIDRVSAKNGNAVINKVLPRKTVFTRKKAGTKVENQIVSSNIDTVFICMSLNNDFNVRRLERYLTIGWDSGAMPVIVLTKSDLSTDINKALNEVEAVALGTDVVVTSSLADDGTKTLMPYIEKGKTIAFIGSSGVGKSSLINKLCGFEKLQTNEIRSDDKGRHTTTKRELILLKDGAIVIDTPGMRELGMTSVQTGIDRSFGDVEALFLKCKFSNCNHTNEPGCAVRDAIESGILSQERWDSYKKLKTEIMFFDNKQSYINEKEKKFKNIAIQNKSNKKK